MNNQKNNKSTMDHFLKKCVANARAINAQKKGTPTRISIFTIASTTQNETSFLAPYLTPVRSNRYFVVTGAVVFNQAQAISIATQLDGLVDIIAVDAEKKVPISAVSEKTALPLKTLEMFKNSSKTVEFVDSGNLAAVCHAMIRKSEFLEFKANDLTVDAVWAFVSSKLKYFSGKKIAVIGAGNIGSKLALKFVESGAEVVINRRDKYIGNTVANAINLIKPSMTIANVSYTDSTTKACFMADVIIGASSAKPCIEWRHVAVSKQDVLLLDVGKGSISLDAITKAFHRLINVYRIDVSAALEGHLLTLLRTNEIIQSGLGRRVIKGIGVVSGGLLGFAGDVVVDNFKAPKSIIGLADGKGDFIRKIGKKHAQKLKSLKKHLGLDYSNVI